MRCLPYIYCTKSKLSVFWGTNMEHYSHGTLLLGSKFPLMFVLSSYDPSSMFALLAVVFFPKYWYRWIFLRPFHCITLFFWNHFIGSKIGRLVDGSLLWQFIDQATAVGNLGPWKDPRKCLLSLFRNKRWWIPVLSLPISRLQKRFHLAVHMPLTTPRSG